MGQVYQATDTKLNRQVALKILPEAFATDPDRLARFQREAQVLASLNHPNIAQIHGLEESGDTRALVLELVEGPTLADRIAQGAIPLYEALPIAKQITEALEAAHEAGVIHRDLKPANIKVKDDGMVKVLDFGLAKALDTLPEGDPSQSPTLTAAATQMGVIMGTAAYMSPEQARGKTVDKRADIWAFGAVLFEMLTGRRPFEGRDVSEVMGAVLRLDPDWNSLPAATPPRLSTLLRRCLDREPRQRVHDVADVRLAMDGGFEAMAPSLREASRWRRPGVLATTAVASGLVVGAAVWALKPFPVSPSSLPMRFSVTPSTPLYIEGVPSIVMTRSGSHIVYSSLASDGDPQLYVRPIGEESDVAIRGGEKAHHPFVSPDGESVGFVEVGSNYRSLKRVSIHGGLSIPIATAPTSIRGVVWGPDDTIVFGTGRDGLFIVPATGGIPEVLTTLDADRGDTDHRWPTFLPGGREVVFTAAGSIGRVSDELAVVSLATGAVKLLGLVGTSARYVSTGDLLFAANGALWAVHFDLDRLEVSGSPVPVVENVSTAINGKADFDVSEGGLLAYVSGDYGGRQRRLVWVDREGEEEPLAIDEGDYVRLALSPDGVHVAIQERIDTQFDVISYDISRGASTRLTVNPSNDTGPIWSADGERVTFAAGTGLTSAVLSSVATARPGEVTSLTTTSANVYAGSWSTDGQQLLFWECAADVGLIRFGGHLPKGEYDVDHGGHEGQAGAAELHG